LSELILAYEKADSAYVTAHRKLAEGRGGATMFSPGETEAVTDNQQIDGSHSAYNKID
jgi:hypothetical protein